MRVPLLAIVVVVTAPQIVSSHSLVSIMEIQGRGHTSPLADDTVVTTGVVTTVARDGCYVQDLVGDGDPATSDALFAYTGTAPSVAVGDMVRVEGAVYEYRPGNDRQNLTVTEISRPAIVVLTSGNPLPAPIRLSRSERVPPTEVIDDDALTRFEPATDGLDFFESVEGMQVLVPDAVAVSVTNRYGEVWVVGDLGRFSTGLAERGGLTISPGDFNPERIQLDDTLLPEPFPLVAVGDTIGDVTGVVSYRFGNFEVLPSSLPPVRRTSTSREVTTSNAGDTELTIASFNAENFDGRDADRVAAIAEVIVTHLRSPDVVALEEVQDDSGPTNDGTVTAVGAYRALIAAVRRGGGPDYDYRDMAPEDGRDGGAPGANIRVGIIFQPARVTFVDRGVASATSATDVVETAEGPALSLSPGRVSPLSNVWEASRKPLAAELIFADQRFFVVACHFSSRSGSSPLFGATQPPVVERAQKRIEQATVVHRFVSRLLTSDHDAHIIVLGDFNDFQFSDALGRFSGALVNLTERLPATERYTYNFEGNSQALDHILVSPSLASRADYDVVHVCADFAESVSDHDPVLARLSFSHPMDPAQQSSPLIASPNPFNASTTVSCVASGADPVGADIFDVAGRKLRSLSLRHTTNGRHEGTWDGLDSRGHPVPSGIYFVRVEGSTGRVTTRILRLR